MHVEHAHDGQYCDACWSGHGFRSCRTKACLQVGCGNSNLAEGMHKAGYQLVNVSLGYVAALEGLYGWCLGDQVLRSSDDHRGKGPEGGAGAIPGPSGQDRAATQAVMPLNHLLDAAGHIPCSHQGYGGTAWVPSWPGVGGRGLPGHAPPVWGVPLRRSH